ncbi:MAG TPA: DoxX family protein [bacterium]|jgi:putative oxidoreductase|nr:DoxX family protein [bacterium]
MKFLAKLQDLAYTLLRVFGGFMFACHGAQKLFGVFGWPMAAPHPGELLWFAGLIELVLGLAIALGIQTRFAAFICSGEMAVAYYIGHWHGDFGQNFFPLVNHGELAVLYCFVFLFIATEGPGLWALDRKN